MRKLDFLVIAGSASVAALMTLVLFWPSAVTAESPTGHLIKKPVLTVNGCEITPTIMPIAAKVGQTPSVSLSVVNTTDQRATFELDVALSSRTPQSNMSRVAKPARVHWSQKCSVVVGPGKSGTIRLEPDLKLPAGSLTLTLANGKQTLFLPVSEELRQVQQLSKPVFAKQIVQKARL